MGIKDVILAQECPQILSEDFFVTIMHLTLGNSLIQVCLNLPIYNHLPISFVPIKVEVMAHFFVEKRLHLKVE